VQVDNTEFLNEVGGKVAGAVGDDFYGIGAPFLVESMNG